MSYILEALKRSQEERELGAVPTLASTPTAQSQPPQGRGNPWVLSALLLAVLAIAVALYAVLNPGNAPQLRKTANVAPDPTAEPMPPSPAPEPPSKAAATDTPLRRPEASRDAGVSKDQGASLPPPLASTPPRGDRRPLSPTHKAVLNKPAPTSPTEPPPPVAPTPRQDDDFRSVIQPLVEEEDAVPAGLREEIEAFKQRIEEESKTVAPVAVETVEATQGPAIPAIEDTGEARQEFVPGLRSLPPAVQATIPPHRISVHVYSADPAQRFVILNSRRMREGDSRGDGLRLERIRPDGVVLSFGRHRFFSER